MLNRECYCKWALLLYTSTASACVLSGVLFFRPYNVCLFKYSSCNRYSLDGTGTFKLPKSGNIPNTSDCWHGNVNEYVAAERWRRSFTLRWCLMLSSTAGTAEGKHVGRACRASIENRMPVFLSPQDFVTSEIVSSARKRTRKL